MNDDPTANHLERRRQYEEQPRSQKPHEPWMCQAHRTSDGELCRKPAIKGGTVCMTHGGAAPQVREAARRRLEAMLPKAANALNELLEGDHAPAKLGAIREIHNRTLGKPGEDEAKRPSGPIINIGFLTPPSPPTPILTGVEVIDDPDQGES